MDGHPEEPDGSIYRPLTIVDVGAYRPVSWRCCSKKPSPPERLEPARSLGGFFLALNPRLVVRAVAIQMPIGVHGNSTLAYLSPRKLIVRLPNELRLNGRQTIGRPGSSD